MKAKESFQVGAPMELIDKTKVLTMICRALNMVDHRLVNHGLKVALVMQDMLKAEGRLNIQYRKKLETMALLHDIGAYREREIDHILQVETKNVWEHAIHGYLFLRSYFPDDDAAKIVLYHHAKYNEVWNGENKEILRYAQMMHIADRICVWHDAVKKTKEEFMQYLGTKVGTDFSPEDAVLFQKADKIYKTWEKLDQEPVLGQLTDCLEISQKEAEDYLYILVDSIDFRSRTTAVHTRSVMEISLEIARLVGLPVGMQKKIYYGALMHDLGKIGIPVSILEKPGRLTEDEMDIMRKHIILGELIISDCVDEEVAQIALRHHEKINGEGYPLGLSGKDLTLPQRLLAVADVLSALCMARSYKEAFAKERCLSILQDMAEKNQIDKELVALVVKEFDFIIETATKRCEPIENRYIQMQIDFKKLISYYIL